MALFKAKRDSESVAERTGGSSKYITQPGIFDVNVIAAFVNEGKGGSLSVDFFIEKDEQPQPLYGNLRISNNDGSENKIGAATFNKLLVILDEDEAADPEEATLPMGKDGADKDVAVIPNLTDFDIKVWVAIEYSVYNGSIKEKKVIRNFYRANDGASAEEIVNKDQGKDVELGAQYAKDLEYLETSENKGVIYKDDLTADQVQEWIKGGRKEGTVGGNTSAAKPNFARKRFGSK